MPKKAEDLQVRFWRSIQATSAEGCWSWIGPRNSYGYGRLMESVGKRKCKQLMAHRFSYEQVIGQIEEGMTVDHTCRNKSCVNPAHMEIVSRGENSKRSYSKNMNAMRDKTCTMGHKIEEGNIVKEIRNNGKERLRCLICSRNRGRKRKSRKGK